MNKLSIILLLLCGFQLNAQFLDEQCGQKTIESFHAANNETYISQKVEIEKFTQEWIAEYKNNPIRQRELVTIPVVVHVVWNTEEENISDLQIESQIEASSADFRKLNANLNSLPPEFSELAADIEIEFCLATVDPFGNPTNGITRTETEFDNIASIFGPGNVLRIFNTDLGGKDGWPTDKYLNMWVGSTGGFPLGFGCMPGTCPPNEDGVVVDPLYFGTTCNTGAPFNLGRTTTHEIGHYLNLYHLWGAEMDDCEEDDLVEDTPIQDAPHFGCPTHPFTSCGTTDMFVNFMDYSDDECLAMFTEGQKLRMLATLNGPRSGLLTSNGCGLINPQPRSISNDAISIFPNPVRGCLHIDVNIDNQTPIFINLHNAMGQRIFTSTNTPNDVRSVDVSSLIPGVYFVNFEVGNQSVTKRIVVE